MAEPTTSTLAWRSRPGPDEAVDRVLDAAGRCYARRGIRVTSVSEIAKEAGCSRPTIYRHFDSGASIRRAFVRREAGRLGASLRSRIDTSAPIADWVTDAVMAAVHDVRTDPALSAWFRRDDVGSTLSIALEPDLLLEVAEALVEPSVLAALGGAEDELTRRGADLAQWIVRVILSFLASPAQDEATERRLVETFVAPALLAG